jgi:hypothetical protein
VKERPILFSSLMIRALLAGTKTQTRRLVKPQPSGDAVEAAIIDGGAGDGVWCWLAGADMNDVSGVLGEFRCPYGVPGDRLWVRETWRASLAFDLTKPSEIPSSFPIGYEAGGGNLPTFNEGKLRPGMFMPRWASRITLEITDARVQPVQEISEADAIAEGVEPVGDRWRDYDAAPRPDGFADPRKSFRALWQSINAKRAPWASNPWVWVLTFARVMQPVIAPGKKDKSA